MQNLKACNHFDGICSIHNHFIQTLKHRCFLTKAHKNTYQCIQTLVCLSLKFALLIDSTFDFNTRGQKSLKASTTEKVEKGTKIGSSLDGKDSRILREEYKIHYLSTVVPDIDSKFNEKLNQLLKCTNTNESRELHIRINVFGSSDPTKKNTNGPSSN